MIGGNITYILDNGIREESLFVHDKPVSRERLWEDMSTDVYLVDRKGLWTDKNN